VLACRRGLFIYISILLLPVGRVRSDVLVLCVDDREPESTVTGSSEQIYFLDLGCSFVGI
jgi:hypothetical protein